jgi:hypothetical protein
VLRHAITSEEYFGFSFAPRKSQCYPVTVITDLDYADDIALITNRAEKANLMLHTVETDCKKVGLLTKTLSLGMLRPGEHSTI